MVKRPLHETIDIKSSAGVRTPKKVTVTVGRVVDLNDLLAQNRLPDDSFSRGQLDQSRAIICFA